MGQRKTKKDQGDGMKWEKFKKTVLQLQYFTKKKTLKKLELTREWQVAGNEQCFPKEKLQSGGNLQENDRNQCASN